MFENFLGREFSYKIIDRVARRATSFLLFASNNKTVLFPNVEIVLVHLPSTSNQFHIYNQCYVQRSQFSTPNRTTLSVTFLFDYEVTRSITQTALQKFYATFNIKKNK